MKLAYKIGSALAAIMVMSLCLSFYAINLANSKPKVMINLIEPQFQTQCASQAVTTALDIDGRLTVSVWNIYKQKRKSWQARLIQLEHASQLLLLQEASLTPAMHQFIAANSLNIAMAKAFKLFGTSLGVMNLSDAAAISACAFHATEPLIRFAKSALVAYYPLSSGDTLLVINLHGINFDWRIARYTQQFEALSEALSLHHGPIILAGDFNTWRGARMDFVADFSNRFNLIEAQYKLDRRQRVFGMALDHLFYRGLDFHYAESSFTDASDHNPITAHFSIIMPARGL